MNISYDYYRIFYYVAKYQSFSAAAKAMLNNQPNLTRSIKRLEQELGCRLFIRKKNGVTLTPEGQKLYEHVSIAFEHIFAGEHEIARDESLQSGLVSISASEIALHCALLPVLKAFHAQYPNVKLRVSNHTTPQALDILRGGMSDLAIVTTPLGPVKSLQHHVLGSIREVPICSSALLAGKDPALTWAELSSLPLISLGRSSNSYAFFSSVFAERGIPFEPDIEVATADQIIPMVKSDLGVGFVPEDFLDTEALRRDIVVLSPDEPLPRREICLLKRADANPSIAARELEKMLLSAAHG